MKDSWIQSLELDELRFLSQVANILETKLGEMQSLTSASDDIRQELDRRKVLEDHPFAGDPANILVKQWVNGKIKKYKDLLKRLRVS